MQDKQIIPIERKEFSPEYKHQGDAGADVRAYIPEEKEIRLKFMERVSIPTGIFAEIPEGYQIEVRPRSGLAAKHGIMVVNSPGTIDDSYRDEIKVILLNTDRETFRIKHGDRIGQFVCMPVVQVEYPIVAKISRVRNRQGGLGSTGVE